MRLIYLNDEGEQLGEVEHSSFHKLLVPFFSENGPRTYIYRHFSSTATYTWSVRDLTVKDNVVTIQLSDAEISKSIGRMAEGNNGNNANRLIKQYGLVEVDFGHKSSVFSVGESLASNTRCADSHLPGELYKRRPCIVLSVSAERVQVMPLTTKGHSSDPASIELSAQSFVRLNGKYTQLPCHTLPRMIQTVSSYRVFPPMLNNGTFPTQCSKYALCSSDKLSLKGSLASLYSADLENEFGLLTMQLDSLKKEKSSIFNALQDAKKELEGYEALDKLIAGIAEEYGAEGSSEDVLRQFLAGG